MDTTPIIAAMSVVLPAGGFIAGVFWGNRIDSKFRQSVIDFRRAAFEALRVRGLELAELRAFKYEVESQRKKAAAKGRAVQTARRLDKQAKERLISAARHSEMRAKLGELV